MKFSALLAVLCLVGCGGGGTAGSDSSAPPSTPTTQQAQLQTGQWEFTFSSSNSNVADSYMETNLQVTGTNLYAPSNAVVGYAPYFTTSAWQRQGGAYFGHPFPAGYITCPDSSYTLSGSTSSGLAVSVIDAGGTVDANLSASLSGSNSTITSISGQSSFTSGDPNSYAPWSCEGDYAASFTATAIATVNGMFVGTLQTSAGPTDQLAISVSQSGYAVSASGTATGATLSVASGNTTVVGALLYGTGSATNANGTDQFTFGSHIHPDGTSIDVVILDSDGTVEWGTISKQ
jgi:hypothetical protein